MMLEKCVNALQNIRTMMANSVFNAIFPAIGTLQLLNAKIAHKNLTTTLPSKSAFSVQIQLHFGMARFVANVPFKLQFGMENIATIVLQGVIGTKLCLNASHAQQVRYTVQSRIFACVLLKLLLCWQPVFVFYVIDQTTGMKEIKSAKNVIKDFNMTTKHIYVSVQQQRI